MKRTRFTEEQIIGVLKEAEAGGENCFNETLFTSMAHARVDIAAWAEEYNWERPHSSLSYATPAAFAAKLGKQWPASLRSTGSATQPIASTALMRKTTARL